MAIKWVTQAEACEAFSLSKSAIQAMRNKEKTFVIGKHYRRKTPKSRVYVYNLEACNKTLSKLCSTPLET